MKVMIAWTCSLLSLLTCVYFDRLNQAHQRCLGEDRCIQKEAEKPISCQWQTGNTVRVSQDGKVISSKALLFRQDSIITRVCS